MIYKFYRLIRFFTDGTVIHLMSIKKPNNAMISNLLQKEANNVRNGKFTMEEDKVSVEFC